jgi:serine/threonine protein phosphatase PrpC
MRRLHGAHSSKSQAGLQLAVARSIGDIELKQPTALLSSEPDVHVRLIDREDQAVVLGCDGVFDVLSNEDVVQLLSSTTDAAWMFSPDATPKQAAGRIVRQAYQKGSTDNISVIVVGIKHDS